MDLADLGPRICIMGPSNSGKSTLAVAIGRARELSVVHLDQLRHQPGTRWQLRPDDEFTRLHEAAIASEHWIIEGNYSRWLDPRLDRATGFILLDVPTLISLTRYLRRSLTGGSRHGGLDGAGDTISGTMIGHILGPTRENRVRYRERFDDIQLTKLYLSTPGAIRRFYRETGLSKDRTR